MSALIASVIFSNKETLCVLLEDSRINPNIILQRDSAISMAVSLGSIEIVDILANHPKIDINIRNMYEETVLFIAIRSRGSNKLEVIEILLLRGADPNATKRWRWNGGIEYQCMTPLHVAAYDAPYCDNDDIPVDHPFETIGLLVRYGANLNAKAVNLRDPIHSYTPKDMLANAARARFSGRGDTEDRIEARVVDALKQFDFIVATNLPSKSLVQATSELVINSVLSQERS